MTNFKLICSFMIIAGITLTSCEKDNALAPSPKEPMAKNKSMNDKDGGSDIDWVALAEYADDLATGTPPESLVLDTALIFIEYALNSNVANWSHTDTTEGEITVSEIEVTISVDDNDKIVGSEAESAYDQILTSLNNTLNELSNPSARVLIIDLDVDGVERLGSTVTVHALTVVNENIPIVFGSGCNIWYDWRAARSNGTCSSGGAGDAASKIFNFLNNCYPDIGEYPYDDYVNIQQKTYSGVTDSPDMWYGLDDTECIPTSMILHYSTEIWNLVKNGNPAPAIYHIQLVTVYDTDVNDDGSSPYYHQAMAFYGEI